MADNEEFQKRKAAALKAAKAQGIVDVVSAGSDGVSLETLELATRLTRKHSPQIYKDLEERRKSQK